MSISLVTIGPCRSHGTHLRDEEHEEGPSDEHVKAKPLRVFPGGERRAVHLKFAML